MADSFDLARDLVARERATSAALRLEESSAHYAGWAQARHDHALDDQTERLLQAEVLNLLEGLSSLLHNDDFWITFEVQGHGSEAERQLTALQGLTRPDLAAMFEMAGYTAPPPPPADELVDASITSLAALDVDHLSEEHLAQAVGRAQSNLAVLLWRTRRQVELADSLAGERGSRAALRTAAHEALRGARAVLPAVVGAGVGAATGAGFGVVAGAAAAKLTEKMLAGGLGRLLGSALLVGGQVNDAPEELRTSIGFDPLAVHLSRMRSLMQGPSIGPAWSDQAREHVMRVATLLSSQGEEAAASSLRDVADCLGGWVWDPKGHLADAIRTVESPEHPVHQHRQGPTGR